jgi:ribosomal RNA-processing protein 17
LKNHVEAVNALLREQVNHQSSDESGSSGDDDDEEEEEWAGFDDHPDNKPVPIGHEDEYVDEDRYTTVTIESIDITKSGLHKSASAEAGLEEDSSVSDDAAAAQEEGTGERKKADGRRLSAKEKPSSKPKVKKKKFRYLSKGDRKATRMKERSGNRAKAKARRA